MEVVNYPKAMREQMLVRTRPLLDSKVAKMPDHAQAVVSRIP